MSSADDDQIGSEQTGLPRRSWWSRLRVGFLSRTIPYYEVRRGRQGDAEVIEAAYRRAKRKQRLPEDTG